MIFFLNWYFEGFLGVCVCFGLVFVFGNLVVFFWGCVRFCVCGFGKWEVLCWKFSLVVGYIYNSSGDKRWNRDGNGCEEVCG